MARSLLVVSVHLAVELIEIGKQATQLPGLRVQQVLPRLVVLALLLVFLLAGLVSSLAFRLALLLALLLHAAGREHRAWRRAAEGRDRVPVTLPRARRRAASAGPPTSSSSDEDEEGSSALPC